MEDIKEVVVFKCKKCEGFICVEKDNVVALLAQDCPHCGEEAHELWILCREDFWRENEER